MGQTLDRKGLPDNVGQTLTLRQERLTGQCGSDVQERLTGQCGSDVRQERLTGVCRSDVNRKGLPDYVGQTGKAYRTMSVRR